MTTVVLDKDDFAGGGVMDFDDMLRELGVETHVWVAGRYIDKEITRVTLHVASVEVDEVDIDEVGV